MKLLRDQLIVLVSYQFFQLFFLLVHVFITLLRETQK